MADPRAYPTHPTHLTDLVDLTDLTYPTHPTAPTSSGPEHLRHRPLGRGYRARETARRDAAFSDPFARDLAW